MEIVVLMLVVAPGLCAVSSDVSYGYHFVYEPKTMTEARRYCRETYTDLATLHNMDDVKKLNEMATLSRMVYDQHSYLAWIGLYDDVDSWRWSLADGGFYTDQEAEYRNWAHREPNNWKGQEKCGMVYDSGEWNDFNCESDKPAVCAEVRGLNATYFYISTPRKWTDAQSFCRQHYTDLASVRNDEENQRVKQLVPQGQSVWIGFFRDSWKWSDGSNASFRYWKNGQPDNFAFNESCASVNFTSMGQWEDCRCEYEQAFICYSRAVKKQVMKVKLVNSNPSLDLNDAAVMENILKQLKQQLKDNGVNEDVKLSWKKQPDGKVFRKEDKKKNSYSNKDEF